ncbi:MAG: hypothetical protein IPI14_13860 [Polaromonas sp.]|nr:hypothetical protein [Polaromonas sp.]
MTTTLADVCVVRHPVLRRRQHGGSDRRIDKVRGYLVFVRMATMVSLVMAL